MGEVEVRRGGRSRWWAAVVLLPVVGAVASGCGGSDPDRSPSAAAPAGAAPSAPADEGFPGALAGIRIDRVSREAETRLVGAAEAALTVAAHPREPLEITDTEDDFVGDAQRAWTLALAHHVVGGVDYARASVAIVEAWSSTTTTLVGACPDTGACSTSLMVSRAAPGLVHAVDVLRADGAIDDSRVDRFHAWIRDVIVPAASDRDNNWGDAGTYLRAVVATELEDEEGIAEAARLWRERIDAVEPDGRIPEEVRRGDAALLYSQEALDYKVATADVLGRHGVDVWEVEGRAGGSLRAAVDLVRRALEDPSVWPVPADDLRVPTPAGMWPIVADRWPDGGFGPLAREAARHDDSGHSAITWTAITHGPVA